MRPEPFVFMRHGQTAANACGLICGRLDVPLDATGRAQARAAQGLLGATRWSCVAVSSALRARQTAQLALPEAALTPVHDLRERDWGELEGLPLAQQCDYLDTPPGGESWADFVGRVQGALDSLLAQFEQPLVIAHSGVWRAIHFALYGTPHGPRIGNTLPMLVAPVRAQAVPGQAADWQLLPYERAVSYTHLTLPTKRIV